MYSARIGQVIARTIFYILLVSVMGCKVPPDTAIHYQELFSLKIGLSENKIAFFHLPNSPVPQGLSVDMRNGLVSIADLGQNKVLTFTSYGDLLRSIYQPAINPQPSYLSLQQDGTLLRNRIAIEYDFYQIEDIAVGENNEIFVVDQLPPDQSVTDERRQIVQDRTVVHFAADGSAQYIGQEGIGGTPFPAIRDIFTVKNNDLVIVCNQDEYWQIYWFKKNGSLRYRMDIDNSHLPALIQPTSIVELVRIVPDPTLDRLYLKIDFFNEINNTDVAVQYEIEQVASRIYWVDLPVGRYTSYLDIPQDPIAPSGASENGTTNLTIPYDFLGVTTERYIVLWGHQLNQKPQILVINTDSDVVVRHEIDKEFTNLLFSDYTLSPQGVIVALQGYFDHVNVVWWRLDSFLRKLR